MATKRIKHIWDPKINEFVPEQKSFIEQLRPIIAWLRSRIEKTTLLQWTLYISILLRIVQLGKGAYWYDEGVSVVFARLPFDRMIQATAGDVHPPGYYLILWVINWIGIPLTEWTSRFPSFLLSVLTVYLTWKLVQRPGVRLRETGKWAVVAWVVISPLQLHYAQEARMYALLQVEVLICINLLIAMADRGNIVGIERGFLTSYYILPVVMFYQKHKQRIWLTVVMTAMLYTHNYAVFYFPSFVVVAWLFDIQPFNDRIKELATGRKINHWGNIKISIKEFSIRWLPWFIVPVVLWLPWFIVLLKQMSVVAGGYWIQPVTVPAVLFVLYQMMFAYSMPPTFQGLGVLLTCGVLIYTSWRIYRDRPDQWLLFAVLALSPVVLSVLLSVIWKPVLLFRGLIGTAIPLIILVVKGIEGIRVTYKKIYAYGLIGVTLIAGVVGHYKYNAVNKGLTTTWVHEIVGQMENGDVVLSLNDNGVIAMKTYAPDMPMYKLKGCGAEPLGSLSPYTRNAIGVEEKTIDELLPTKNKLIPSIAGPVLPLHTTTYNRVFFLSTVAPVSPACEIEMANAIIAGENTRLLIELSETEYTQAGVYIVAGDIY